MQSDAGIMTERNLLKLALHSFSSDVIYQVQINALLCFIGLRYCKYKFVSTELRKKLKQSEAPFWNKLTKNLKMVKQYSWL